VRPICNIIIAKWTRNVGQVTEHLLCKYKASLLNPSAHKKKKQSTKPKAVSFRRLGWGYGIS
jgi:hypothetical protein